jgi:hypothetical protein
MLLVKDRDSHPRQAAGVAAAKPVRFGLLLASPVTWGTVIATFCYLNYAHNGSLAAFDAV